MYESYADVLESYIIEPANEADNSKADNIAAAVVGIPAVAILGYQLAKGFVEWKKMKKRDEEAKLRYKQLQDEIEKEFDNDPNVNKKLGTRHRAALGISEETDAIALIVSEETGRISIAVDSKLHHNLTLDEFKIKLLEELKPKADVFYDADEEGENDE